MTPARFRDIVSTVLLVGVVTSAAFLAAGVAGAFVVGWDGSLIGAASVSGHSTDFSAVVPGLTALRPIALAQAGLLVLIATPVLRILTSVAAFALEGDRLYAAITLAVLVILLVSLFAVR